MSKKKDSKINSAWKLFDKLGTKGYELFNSRLSWPHSISSSPIYDGYSYNQKINIADKEKAILDVYEWIDKVIEQLNKIRPDISFFGQLKSHFIGKVKDEAHRDILNAYLLCRSCGMNDQEARAWNWGRLKKINHLNEKLELNE